MYCHGCGCHLIIAYSGYKCKLGCAYSGEARISIQGGQDLLLYYIFSIISINYKYIFYIKTKITNLYSSQ